MCLLLLRSLLHPFDLYVVFVLFLFYPSLLIDYEQPALMSKLAFLAAHYSIAWLCIILFVTSLCYAHVTNKYDDHAGQLRHLNFDVHDNLCIVLVLEGDNYLN